MLAGANHDTVACPLPAIAVTPVGAPGPAIGVTAVEAADAAELPTPLVATTLKVYAVPFVRPVTVHRRPDEVHVFDPGVDVTV